MTHSLFESTAWPALKRLNNQLQTVVDNTVGERIISGIGDPWETTYNLVFSALVSKPIYNALEELNQKLDYYDPDASYEEDVQAFASAVNDKVVQLQALLDNGPAYVL